MPMDLNKIKYYPDRFYIRLDGFDLNNLNHFAEDATFSLQQAIYVHEYYHYLTNITTFFGAREFNVAFQDKVRLITILSSTAGLDAFPINSNTRSDCKSQVDYWNEIDVILDLDDIDDDFVAKVETRITKRLEIVRYHKRRFEMNVPVNGKIIRGAHCYYTIDVKGVPNVQSFVLSDGIIDEFLNGSIDEFMFQNDLANNCEVLRNQPYFPYRAFDDLISFFKITDYLEPKYKIMIAYFALHSFNPVDCLIETLKAIKKCGIEFFLKKPESFLLSLRKGNELDVFSNILKYEESYVNECCSHGRRNLADTMALILDKQIKAHKCLCEDYFYYIRPFLVSDINDLSGRQEFLRLFQIIRSELDEPILVQEGKMIDADEHTYKNHLALQIASYEIFDSLTVNRIAKRILNRKNKYEYPKTSPNNDKIENLPDQMPLVETWHVALNDLGLYGEYLKEKTK